jgi:phospho-N-acetylmuramoyl-pentapeptide-transferase
MNTHITLDTIIDRFTPLFGIGALSFVLAILLTPAYTFVAYKYKLWKKPRTQAVTGEAAPIFHKLHAGKHKRNIPTMAGVIILLTVTVITLLFNLDRRETWLPLGTLLVFGGLGLIDDVSNVFFQGTYKGLKVRTQMLALIVLSGIAAWWFYFKLDYHVLSLPFGPDFTLSWMLYIPFFILVVFSTSKAVSITDGLDGLAGGLLSIAFGAFSFLAFLQGNTKIALFCATIVGAMLAYTWFNIYPARFFMGQTGSVALGAVLGIVAILSDLVFILPIIGLVFVVEAGSSFVQVFSKKVFKRKIFLSAPIHHHFEAIGWPETKVTMRFWIIGQLASMLGIFIAAVGGLL